MNSTLPAEDQVGSPLPVKLGGRDLLLSPMNLDITGTMKREAREAVYAEARRRLDMLIEADINTPENRKEIVWDLFRDLDNGNAFAKHMNSPEGTVNAVWMMLILRHPDITKEFVAQNIGFGNVREWQRKMDRVTFPVRETDTISTDEDVTEAAKGRKAGPVPNVEAPADPGPQSQPQEEQPIPRTPMKDPGATSSTP
jgi:hypothetical protein